MQRKSSTTTTSPSRVFLFGALTVLWLLGASPRPAITAKPLSALLDPHELAGKHPWECGILTVPDVDLRLRKLLRGDFYKLGTGLQVQGLVEHVRTKAGDYLVLSGNKMHAAFDLRLIVAFDLERDRISVGFFEGSKVTRYFEHFGGRKVVGRKAVFPFETALPPWWMLLRIRD